MKSGRPSPNHVYKIHDPLGLKLLRRLRLGLSQLNEHRFNTLCSCSLEVDSIKYFFLHCHHQTNICKSLLNTVVIIHESILNVNDDDLIEILLFGNCKFSLEVNLYITKASLNYIKDSERFDKPLFWTKKYFLHHRFCVIHVLRFSYFFHNVLFSPPFWSYLIVSSLGVSTGYTRFLCYLDFYTFV